MSAPVRLGAVGPESRSTLDVHTLEVGHKALRGDDVVSGFDRCSQRKRRRAYEAIVLVQIGSEGLERLHE